MTLRDLHAKAQAQSMDMPSPQRPLTPPVQPTKQVQVPPTKTVAWPCPHCGTPAEVEAVEPSLDGTRTLTYRHCDPCQIWAVPPATIRQPPVWVPRAVQ